MHALTALLTILLLLPVSAVAETWGSLEVTVHDPSGALLPDATVRVVEAGLEARSDRMGRALFDHLLPGRYTLLVVADHLEPVDSVRTSVTADALQRVSVSFVSVRSRATQVDVTGDDADLLRRIPGSADLLSARELADSHSIDANEVLRRIPGLTMREDSGPVGTRLNIGVRGLNPDRSRQVLILEDGLPLALAPYGEPEMYYSPPIERALRVEVLKGSGSILFGPQTIGGVVNFVTPDPPSRPRGALQLTGGQGGLFIAQGSYGTTAGRIGAFASALHKQGDGFRQFAFDINDLSTKLTFSLSPRQSLGVKFQWYEETSNSTYLGLTKPQFDADSNTNVVPDDHLDVSRVFGSVHHRAVLSDRATMTTTAFAYDTRRFWRRQDFDRRPQSSRRYVQVAGDPSIAGGAVFLRDTSASRNRQFRVAGLESRLTVNHQLLGRRQVLETGARYLYERAEDRQINWTAVTGGIGTLADAERRPAEAISAFAQTRLTLAERVILTPGLRLEHYEYTRHIVKKRVNGVPTDVNIRSQDRLFEPVPGLGLTIQAHPALTMFAGAHRGFAPPRVKDAIDGSGASLQLDAERSWNYETGVRWRQPGGAVHADATVFVLDFSNQIIPAAQSGGATTTLVNAGRTLHKGAEFSAGWDLPVPRRQEKNISCDLRYTYLPVARFESGIFNGNRLPYAPHHALNTLLTYRSRDGLTIQLNGVFVGAQWGDNNETRTSSVDGTVGRLPSYVLWNLSGEYRLRAGRFQARPFVAVKNLTDRVYIASRAPEGIQPGPFRQIHGGVRVDF